MNKHGENMMGNIWGTCMDKYGENDGKQHVCSWWFSRDFFCVLDICRAPLLFKMNFHSDDLFLLEMWCAQTPSESRLLIFWRLGRT